ncbi:MAG: HlyD family efflux transporter periplasmic adaptor subunit [Candidatus Omnitrophica bacterium]|nr:HlyD family efflux transporter periplasmic adaptor subunit [Candidatus Omnitrophota bacterium]
MKNLFLILSLVFLVGCTQKPDVFHAKYSGTLELTEHVLGAKVAGRLTSLSVKEGDMVKASQVLATLDRYEQTKKDYERAQELLKIGGTNAQAIEYAKLAMEDQQIISPIDGIVLVKAAEVGETLSAGAGVVVIGNLQDQWIKVFLPEGLIGQVILGQKASIVFDGLNQSYEGHVSFIATKAEFTPRNVQSPEERITQVFAVKVALDKPDEHVHPGVAADVEFRK